MNDVRWTAKKPEQISGENGLLKLTREARGATVERGALTGHLAYQGTAPAVSNGPSGICQLAGVAWALSVPAASKQLAGDG